MTQKRGLIHLYCGDGKGKTTAAMGLCMRAAGAGLQVVVVQFLKNGDSSELSILSAHKNVTVLAGKGGDKFTCRMTDTEKAAARTIHDKNLDAALAIPCDLLLLDEAAAACRLGLVDEKKVKALCQNKPPRLELVLTGRNPPDFMVQAADYITEMRCVRHPYQQGIGARKGIEF